MGMRAQSEIPTPKTPWDDMLAEMKWLREDFRCEPGRREAFFREISGPCIQEAHRRLSSTSEGKGWAPGLEPSVPEWAKKEYLVQTLLRQATQPEPAYEAEKDVGVDVTTRFSKPLPTRKRKTQSESGVRRSKRLRHLDADATDEDNVQND